MPRASYKNYATTVSPSPFDMFTYFLQATGLRGNKDTTKEQKKEKEIQIEIKTEIKEEVINDKGV